MDQWNKRQEETQKDTSIIDTKIMELKTAARATAEKIRFLSSETAIRYMEEDLIKYEQQIQEFEANKLQQQDTKKGVNMELVLANVSYFLEHLEELLIGSPNRLKGAEYFSLLFDSTPTYQDLTSGTAKLARYLALKPNIATALVPVGEPAVPQVELFFENLIKVYNHLSSII